MSMAVNKTLSPTEMKDTLQLIEPTPGYEPAYRRFLADYQSSGEKMVPFTPVSYTHLTLPTSDLV